MKTHPNLVLTSFLALLSAASSHAQTWTWVGGATNSGNQVSFAANWNPASVPTSGADLLFNTTTNNFVGFNILPFTFNSLTFASAATNPFTLNGNGNTLSIGAGGITTNAGSGGVNFNGSTILVLTANETWTTDAKVFVGSNLQGGFMLTKAGSGSLSLAGGNSYTGGTTITAGALYLSPWNSSSGTIVVGSSGTLGTVNTDVTLSNAVTVASGATLGGSLQGDGNLQLNGTVTAGAGGSTTINVGSGAVIFTGTLTAPSATDLTFHGTGTGLAILTNATANMTSMTADNAGIGFGMTSTFPTGSIQAVSGGYVSIVDAGGATPTLAALMGKITDKTNFNGTIGLDTGKQATKPTVYGDAIDLTGFTPSQVTIGTATNAVLTGTITLPVGEQSYSFKGFGDFGGGLFVQSNLVDQHSLLTTVSIFSPNSSGAASGGGLGVIFQGANTFTGNVAVDNSLAIFDSAAALPSGTKFVLSANSYAGYTETTGLSFANFVGHLTGGASAYTSTSILGLDSHGPLADFVAGTSTGTIRTVTDPIDLSALSPIFLGTITGVTIDSSVAIKAPNDGVLRLVNLEGKFGPFTINAPLATGNVTSLVVGMPGAKGAINLTAANTYTGGTTLQGGTLLVGNDGALGSGAVTVLTSDSGSLTLGASSGSVSLSNDIAVTKNLNIGTGYYDNTNNFVVGTTTLILDGNISNNVSAGRLYITGPTTLNGTNTYSGGTYVYAATTVNNNSGLGTYFVDLGYNATLTLTSASPAFGSLADAGNYVYGAGTGNVALGSGTLNINGTSAGTFSGVISGTGGLTRSGTGNQTLSGTNLYTGATTLSGGTLTVSTIGNGGVAGNLGAASNAAANLIFDGGTLQYTGATASTDRNFTINTGKTAGISVSNGASSLTLSGASTATNGGLTKMGGGTLILNGTNTYTGATAVNGGKLFVNGSLASAVTVGLGATLGGTGSLDGGATINSGGHLAPGVGAGTILTNGLTLLSGAIIDFQLGSTSDKVFVTGGTFSVPLIANSVTLNLSNIGSFGAGNYTLFDFSTGATTNSFVASDFAFGTTIPGYSYGLALLGNTLVLTATAVPEPSTYAALAGLAVLGLAAYRRRRKHAV